MERLTNRDKEIPLPNADNALFWARVHEKLARYEDAEEHTYFASKPQTNADRIRSMTDEELAEWYWWMLRYVQGYTDSRVALLDWLKQEAKE